MNTATTTTKHTFVLEGFPFTFSDACGVSEALHRIVRPYLSGYGDAAMRHASCTVAMMSSFDILEAARRDGTLGKHIEQAITHAVTAAGEATKHLGGNANAVQTTERHVVLLVAFWLRNNTDWR